MFHADFSHEFRTLLLFPKQINHIWNGFDLHFILNVQIVLLPVRPVSRSFL